MVIGTWRAYIASFSVRQAVVFGIVVLAAAGGLYLSWEDAPAPPEILHHSEQAPSPHLEITGLSAAAERMPLRNPFSAAHESAGEAFVSPLPVHETMQMPPAAAAAATAAPAEKKAPALPLVLHGVVTSAGGTRIAVLGQGEEGAALTVGEEWHGYRLEGLTDTTATLRAASGTVTLMRE